MIDDTQEFVAEDDLPPDEGKPTLESFVERGVNIKREMAILKDDMNDIASQAKTLFRVSKRDFNALVKYSFEKDINADIEELQAIQTKLKNLGSDLQGGEQGELFGEEN